jgi:hypothetical protein
MPEPHPITNLSFMSFCYESISFLLSRVIVGFYDAVNCQTGKALSMAKLGGRNRNVRAQLALDRRGARRWRSQTMYSLRVTNAAV